MAEVCSRFAAPATGGERLVVPGDLGDPNGGRKDLVARTEAALARCTDEPDRLTGRVACSLQLLTDLAAVIARQEANMAPCE